MGEKAEDLLLEIGETVEGLLGAMKLPLPPEFHLECLKAKLEEIAGRIRGHVAAEEGGE